MEAKLEFSVLGPLRVSRDGGPLDIGPIRRQALLAVLLLARGRAQSKQQLLDAVWGEDVPATGEKIIPTYVYSLRQALDEPGAASVIGTRDGGYRIEPGAAVLDLDTFTALNAEAVTVARHGDPARARDLLRAAEALWSGEPLAGLPGPEVALHRSRLAELRQDCVRRRVDLDLELGRAAQLVPELRARVAADPVQEATAGQLMRALDACGRRAEALSVYAATQAALGQRLGIEPGPQLRELHRRLLAGTPAQEPADQASPLPDWVTRCDLPAAPREFVGRAAELDRLLDTPGTPGSGTSDTGVRLIAGMAGVGKTALALRAAQRLAERHPDGQICVDLHGYTAGRPPAEPGVVLGRLLRTVGVPAEQVPLDADERAAMWRAVTAGRRLLLLLDNARSAEQVRPLLPGAAAVGTVLVTSRENLYGLDADVLALGMLTPAESLALFETLHPAAATEQRADGRAEVVRLCGHLPLAVRMAAARLRSRPGWSLDYFADRLHDRASSLHELGGDGGVAAVFALSYAGLAAAHQEAFTVLGALPGGEFDAYPVAAALGTDLAAAQELLGALLDANLLGQRGDGRYLLHDLLRRYAVQRFTDRAADERFAVHARLYDFYLHTVRAANREFVGYVNPRIFTSAVRHEPPSPRAFAEVHDALDWIDREYPDIAALLLGTDDPRLGERLWQTVEAMSVFHTRAPSIEHWKRLTEHALTAARAIGSVPGEQALNGRLGTLYVTTGPVETALAYYDESLRLAEQLGDPYAELRARYQRALALTPLARHGEAITELEAVRELAGRYEDAELVVIALNNVGVAYLRSGRFAEAIERLREAVRMAMPVALSASMANLGVAQLRAGLLDEAAGTLTEAARLAENGGDTPERAYALAHLGVVLAQRGDSAGALALHRQVEEILPAVEDAQVVCAVLDCAGETCLRAGQPADGLACHRRALAAAQGCEDIGEQINAYAGMARCLAALGDPDASAAHWARAGELCAGLDLPIAAEISAQLDGSAQSA